MKQAIFGLLGLITLLAVGLGTNVWSTDAHAKSYVVERVHANLVRVKINGTWEDFPLMPLADRACRSRSRLFRNYCDDDVRAPRDE